MMLLLVRSIWLIFLSYKNVNQIIPLERPCKSSYRQRKTANKFIAHHAAQIGIPTAGCSEENGKGSCTQVAPRTYLWLLLVASICGAARPLFVTLFFHGNREWGLRNAFLAGRALLTDAASKKATDTWCAGGRVAHELNESPGGTAARLRK